MRTRPRYATWTRGPEAGASVRPEGPDDSWLRKWAPRCPDGNAQRLCEIVAFRLKGADYLQLRVVLTPADRGVCQAIIDEHADRIYVRAIACQSRDVADRGGSARRDEEVGCPCNVWLNAPLGERVVVDVDTKRELPLYIPRWGTGEPCLYVPRPAGTLWPPDATAPLLPGPPNDAS
jgi:hypothetical protein